MARGRSAHHPFPLAQAPPIPAPFDDEGAIRAVPALAGADLPLVSLVGSHAYGLATPESDRDYRGIYLADTTALLRLGSPADQLEANEPDICCFEIEKFCRLALAANPNVLEILWAHPVIESGVGARLRDVRQSFLSQKVRTTYTGYAFSQMKKAVETGQGDRRRPKAIRHLFRLYEQGAELLATGELTLRLRDPERIRAYESMDDVALKREFQSIADRVKTMTTDLPEEPDSERISELLLEIRLEQLASAA